MSTEITLESLGLSPQDITLPATPPVDTGLTAPSSHHHEGVTTGVEERALKLLGAGIQAEAVAAALGVTPGRIAQLLAVEVFSAKVASLRFKSLSAHNERDGKYDSLEDQLLVKLEKAIPLMMKPETIVNALTRVNAAQRRGSSAPAQVNTQQNIVTLVLPNVIANKFQIDTNNQVIKAGNQDLITMPSGNLLKRVEEAQAQEALLNAPDTDR